MSQTETQSFVLKYDNVSDFADLLSATVELVRKGPFDEEKNVNSCISIFEKLDQMLSNLKSRVNETEKYQIYDEALFNAGIQYAKFCNSVADPTRRCLFVSSLGDKILDVVYRLVLLKKQGPRFNELALEYFEEVAKIYSNSTFYGNNNYIYLLEFVLRSSSRDFSKANLEILVKSLFLDEKKGAIRDPVSYIDVSSSCLSNYQNSFPDLLAEVVLQVGEPFWTDPAVQSDWSIKLREGQGR